MALGSLCLSPGAGGRVEAGQHAQCRAPCLGPKCLGTMSVAPPWGRAAPVSFGARPSAPLSGHRLLRELAPPPRLTLSPGRRPVCLGTTSSGQGASGPGTCVPLWPVRVMQGKETCSSVTAGLGCEDEAKRRPSRAAVRRVTGSQGQCLHPSTDPQLR